LRFLARQGKSYATTEEFQKRKALWLEADAFIKGYQATTFTMEHNRFSDWTPEEKKKILGGKPRVPPTTPVKKQSHKKEKLDAFWIFAECEPNQYKSWLMGCRDCDVGC
jgi:hypothetical protein